MIYNKYLKFPSDEEITNLKENLREEISALLTLRLETTLRNVEVTRSGYDNSDKTIHFSVNTANQSWLWLPQKIHLNKDEMIIEFISYQEVNGKKLPPAEMSITSKCSNENILIAFDIMVDSVSEWTDRNLHILKSESTSH